MALGNNYLGVPQTDLKEWVGTVPASVRASTQDYATATHAAATITIPAPPLPYGNVLTGVAWSYIGGTPVGSLTVSDGSGNTVFSQDLNGVGNGSVVFNPPKRFGQNTATIITLADGGVSVVGKVSLLGHYADTVPSMASSLVNSGEMDFSQPLNSEYIPVLAL